MAKVKGFAARKESYTLRIFDLSLPDSDVAYCILTIPIDWEGTVVMTDMKARGLTTLIWAYAVDSKGTIEGIAKHVPEVVGNIEALRDDLKGRHTFGKLRAPKRNGKSIILCKYGNPEDIAASTPLAPNPTWRTRQYDSLKFAHELLSAFE
jgi:hypothetical protein